MTRRAIDTFHLRIYACEEISEVHIFLYATMCIVYTVSLAPRHDVRYLYPRTSTEIKLLSCGSLIQLYDLLEAIFVDETITSKCLVGVDNMDSSSPIEVNVLFHRLASVSNDDFMNNQCFIVTGASYYDGKANAGRALCVSFGGYMHAVDVYTAQLMGQSTLAPWYSAGMSDEDFQKWYSPYYKYRGIAHQKKRSSSGSSVLVLVA